MAQRSLNILFRVGPFPKLSETFVLSQIEGMVQRGHNVSVLADNWSADEALVQSDIIRNGLRKVAYLTPKNALWQKAPYRFREARKSFIYKKMLAANDVVVCHFGWFGADIAERLNETSSSIKLATIFHGADMSSHLKDKDAQQVYGDLFARGDLFLPISNFWQDKLIALGAPKDLTHVHRMGVFPDTFTYNPRTPANNDTFNFITVGRLTEKKGVEYAIRAFANAKTRSDNRQTSLTIIGEGPLETELKSLAADLKIADAVTFTGSLPHAEVAKKLKAAHAFVLPSVVAVNGDMEGVPVALMEAMASGLPVLSTYHSGIPELIAHEKTGLLAPERDVDALTTAMLRIQQDKALRTRMVEAARHHVVEHFNNHICNDQLSDMLINLSNTSLGLQSRGAHV